MWSAACSLISRRTSFSISARRTPSSSRRSSQGIDRSRYGEAGRQPLWIPCSGEHYIKAVVGIGTPIGNVKDLAYQLQGSPDRHGSRARCSIPRSQIIRYDNLGIARLIYQLPTTVCEMFLREVFKQGSIESLDQRDAVHHPALLREQPERFRNQPRPVRPPQHAGVPSGKDQKADRPGPA